MTLISVAKAWTCPSPQGLLGTSLSGPSWFWPRNAPRNSRGSAEMQEFAINEGSAFSVRQKWSSSPKSTIWLLLHPQEPGGSPHSTPVCAALPPSHQQVWGHCWESFGLVTCKMELAGQNDSHLQALQKIKPCSSCFTIYSHVKSPCCTPILACYLSVISKSSWKKEIKKRKALLGLCLPLETFFKTPGPSQGQAVLPSQPWPALPRPHPSLVRGCGCENVRPRTGPSVLGIQRSNYLA